MSDQPLIRDDSPRPTTHQGPPPSNGDQPEPVDVSTLEDYEQYAAWKASQAETAAAAEGVDLPRVIELSVAGQIQTYQLAKLDRNVIDYLQALTTFSENDIERAQAVFKSLLHPQDYQRLKKDLIPALDEVRMASLSDPEAPTVSEVWSNLAKSVMEPFQELTRNPKLLDSLGGPSPTGPSLKPASTPSGLPSLS